MSWSYDYFNVSGYSTGITGIQINEGVYLQVSGLKYDGITFNNTHLEWLTGIGFITSGVDVTRTGIFIFNSDSDHWETIIAITGAAEVGNTATGTYEWYWNSGGAYFNTAKSTGIVIFANANTDRWNTITNANSSVNNADIQHSHAGYAQQLQDLDDIARTGAFVYTSGYYLSANGYNSFEVIPFPNVGVAVDPTGYETVSGSYISHILDSTAHINPTGYEMISGSWIVASGDLDDYKYVSGRYSLTSGSYNSHIISAIVHHNPSGYETVSGLYISHILDSVAHINPSGYETVSGSWIAASGDLDDYKYVSGRYVLTSGAYNSHIISAIVHHDPSGYETVSGSYITHIIDSTAHINPTGYETVSGSYISHIADTNAHIVDIIDITRANFSGLTDMSSNEAVLINSINDSGTSWASGTVQGQFFFDTESFYKWDNTAGAWIEIGASSYGALELGDLQDVDLSDTITDGNALVYSTSSGAWTTGVSVLDHNDLPGLNDGIDYEHITQTQKDDLHSDVIVSVANVEAVITAEIAPGESIDNAVDAVVLTHKNIATAHQDAPALILTHKNIATAHQNAPGLIATHATDDDAHHAVYLNANAVDAVNAAGLVLAASKAIQIDGTPADDTYTGIILFIDTTGCAVGDAVYVDGTNSVLPADANAIGTMPAIGIVVAAGKVLTHGVYRDDSVLVLATASKVYVSTTPGDLTITAPSGNGDIVQVFGITVGTDMIFVNPSLDWVEVVV